MNQGLDCMGLRSSMGTKNSSPAKGEQKRWGKVINNYIFSPSGLSEGVSWVFSSCSASVGFLMRYYGELREPLMWRLGSQVSMRIARGSASLL